MRLMVDITAHSDHVVVRCKGRLLDENDMASLARSVLAMQSAPTLVLVDLSHVEAIRVANLGLLWLHFMEANARGWKLVLVRMTDRLSAFLRSCGLEDSIPAFESEDRALQALSAPLAARARAAS